MPVMPEAGESGGMSAQVGNRDTREPRPAGTHRQKMGRRRGSQNADGVVITRAVGAVMAGMSPKAVALDEGVPETTVRSWLRRNGVRRIYRKS